ncbi:MAG: sugar transferase [Lachnospiraceae bacterium]|nr:sugar transferase [Lachnospiraceae bacterium]
MYRKFVKRMLDFILAFTGLVVISPVLLVLAVLVRTKLGSPVLFHQDRPGYREKIFRLYKFRTMTDERDASGALLPDKDRLTSFGLFLRKTSLDELPELFNILKGDMSLIGPRPLLPEYLPYYTEREKKRHSVRPGLTGLAQASGRNLVDWDRRMALDAEYAEQLSFALDLKIIGMTIRQVLGHSDDVAADTNAAEGNFAAIRRERLEKTGSLEAPVKEQHG